MRLKQHIVALYVILFVFGISGTWGMFLRADRELRGEILRQATIVAEATNLDHLNALEGNDADLTKPGYLLLKEKFASIRQASDRYRFIYLLGRKADDTLFFFVDDCPVGHKDESPAGMEYPEAPEEFGRIMKTGLPEVVGPYSDRWGNLVTACIPLVDKQTGKTIALLSVDVDASAWQWDVAGRAAVPVGLILVVMIGSMAVLAATGRSAPSPKPVLRRLLLPLTTMVVFLSAGGAILLWQQYQFAVDQRIAALNSLIAAELQVDLRNQAAILSMALQSIVTDPRVRQALRNGDADRLLSD